MEKIINTIKAFRFDKIYLLTMFPVVVYLSIFFNKGFPLTEGWFSLFARQMNSGDVIYKDFFFIFPPVYVNMIAKITAIWGYDFIVLRIFGALVFLSIATLFYLIFKKVFNRYISFFITLVAVFYAQLEVCYIYYDYSRIFDLFTLLAIFFYLKYLDDNNDNKINQLSIFVSGFFVILSAFVRQSSGFIDFLYIPLLLITTFLLSGNKKHLKGLLAFTAGSLMAFLINLIYIWKVSGIKLFIDSVFVSAASAKGGMQKIMTTWFSNIFPIHFTHFFVYVGILLINLFQFKKHDSKRIEFSVLSIVIFSILLGVLFLLLSTAIVDVSIIRYLEPKMSTVFVLTIIVFIVCFVLLLKARISGDIEKQSNLFKYFSVSGFAIALAVGACTSGGFAQAQLALAFAFLTGLLLNFTNYKFKFVKNVFVTYIFLLVLNLVIFKLLVPYSWWYYNLQPVQRAQYEVNIPILKGIKVDEPTKYVLEDATKTIKQYITKPDDLFCFMHTAIFYLTTDTKPKSHALLHWFDVAPDKIVLQDIKTLMNDRPKVILIMNPPDVVYEKHELLFRDNRVSSQKFLLATLYKIIIQDKYVLKKAYRLSKPYGIEIWVKE